MEGRARKVLAATLTRLMAESSDLKTQKAVHKRSKVAQTTISNMLNPDTPAMKSPKLDTVEKVANAFGLEAWQLIVETETLAQHITAAALRPTHPQPTVNYGKRRDDRHDH